MKYLLALGLAVCAPSAFAADSLFVGYKYIPGDTAWFESHINSNSSVGVTNGKTTVVRTEQLVSHHQYTTSHTDSGSVLVMMYDSLKIRFGGDSLLIDYDSNNPADTQAAYNMMVYPLKSMLGFPLTVYINAKGKVDSLHGLEEIVDRAVLGLGRSGQIATLREALNTDRVKDLIEQSLLNLPNTMLSTDGAAQKFSRARMVGNTQFLDEVATQLVRVTPDTAWLNRATYTRVASPTITFAGSMCVIDSTWGTGNANIVYDVPRGVVLDMHDEFQNYLRASVANTTTQVIQFTSLTADTRLIGYAAKSTKGKESKKRR